MQTMMLKGTFPQAMDLKGRMTFPNKLREVIGERFIVTRGFDGCLFVYSLENFERKAEKIQALPMAKGRDVQRFFMSWACEVEADKQGRILIPQNLRDFAKLEKDIVVTGVSDRAEIWSKNAWDALNSQINEEQLMTTLEELDF